MIVTNIDYENNRVYVIGDTVSFSISYDRIGIYPYEAGYKAVGVELSHKV